MNCQYDRRSICKLCGVHDAARSIRQCTSKGSPPPMRRVSRPPCAYLGMATGGRHKVQCQASKVTLAGHYCYHARRRLWLPRRGEFANGYCTPGGSTVDAEQGIQPCRSCPLHVPQRLLTVE